MTDYIADKLNQRYFKIVNFLTKKQSVFSQTHDLNSIVAFFTHPAHSSFFSCPQAFFQSVPLQLQSIATYSLSRLKCDILMNRHRRLRDEMDKVRI